MCRTHACMPRVMNNNNNNNNNANNNANNGRASTKRRPTPKFVEEGSYGCVMAPALRCDGQGMNTKSVSKIYEADSQGTGVEEAKKEFGANELLTAIDPERVFTLATHAACRVNSARIDPAELKKCSMFKAIMSRKQLPQLVMENGGIGLNEILKENDFNVLKSQDANAMMASLWRLFYGIKMMSDKHLIHQDIKSENILVAPEKIALIDFGILSKHWDRHYENVTRAFLRHSYDVFPPEYNILEAAYLTSGTRGFRDQRKVSTASALVCIKMVDRIASRIRDGATRAYITTFLKSWMNTFGTYYKRVNDLVFSKITFKSALSKSCTLRKSTCDVHPAVAAYARHLDAHAGKIDVYSLGVVMLKVVTALAAAETITLPWLKVYLGSLVAGMIHPNPEQRYTANDAFEAYKRLASPKNAPSPRAAARRTPNANGY